MSKGNERHSFIDFKTDLARLSFQTWINLGEISSKSDHLCRVPLQPQVADRLQTVFLAKGVHATTAIEGNTLTEAQVKLQIEGNLDLPPSREYLRQEVSNLLDIYNRFSAQVQPGGQYLLKVNEILKIQEMLFEEIEVEDHVLRGALRTTGVTVADYEAPSADKLYDLLTKFCDWLNHPSFLSTQSDLKIPMAVIRAVLAHLYFAWIHPFGDGNGRTARALEFLILVGAGVPSPAAHVLSNYYNLTRERYYKELRYASNTGDPLPFISYAVSGFAEGLREQLELVYSQLISVAMRDYIYEEFSTANLTSRQKVVVDRRRKLLLGFAAYNDEVLFQTIKEQNAEVAVLYSTLTRATFETDIQSLVDGKWLIEGTEGRYRVNYNLILRYLPRSPITVPVAQNPLL